MTNKEIATAFQYLGNLMELHEENPFKIKSYLNAYLIIRKLPDSLSEMTESEMEQIKGIGKTISHKVTELITKGKLTAIEEYEAITPSGISEMLLIRGFGPKKVRVIWKELGVETVGELLYACNENRLVALKGFGQKTQADLIAKLEYFQKSQGTYRYADLEPASEHFVESLKGRLPEAKVSMAGAIRRKSNLVERIEVLIGTDSDLEEIAIASQLQVSEIKPNQIHGTTEEGLPVTIRLCSPDEFGSKLFRFTAGEEFLSAFLSLHPGVDFSKVCNEQDVFAKSSLTWLEPELRENDKFISLAVDGRLPKLLDLQDIQGVVHAHTTGSEGMNSVTEMAIRAGDMGYKYLGVTDHSKSAFYANGMQEERLISQWQEIDRLNIELAPFKIFKGIESDILNDGSLDYPNEILAKFDFIIASVHSNLRMDEQKATKRLIKAIENPYTTIIGHLTGRLLLSRIGYPVDHEKIIDACAANHVAIELNANPYRLDMDSSWIPRAIEKGVLISINPDAHSLAGIKDIHFGVLSARRGGLQATECLTCFNVTDFQRFIQKRKT